MVYSLALCHHRKKLPSGPEQEEKAAGRGERRRGLAKLHSQASEEREAEGRRESRRLSRGRSQECEVTRSGEGQRRTERPPRPLSGDYHGERNAPRHTAAKPLQGELQAKAGSRGRPGEAGTPGEQGRPGEARVGGGRPLSWSEVRVPGQLPNQQQQQRQVFGMVDRTVGGGGTQGGSLAPKQNQTQGPLPPSGAQPPPPGLHTGPLAAPTAGIGSGHVPPGPGLGPPPGTGPVPVPGTGPDLREPPEWGRKPQPSHLDPGSAALLRRSKRQKAESMLRNDSLSSDQSESLRPPPPRPYKGKRGGNKRQMSVSSSEEEGGSTPEYTSCEDVDIESVSERGEKKRLT